MFYYRYVLLSIKHRGGTIDKTEMLSILIAVSACDAGSGGHTTVQHFVNLDRVLPVRLLYSVLPIGEPKLEIK